MRYVQMVISMTLIYTNVGNDCDMDNDRDVDNDVDVTLCSYVDNDSDVD